MDINILGSGSSGNAYILKDGDRKIIIDPGLPIKEIRRKTPFNLATLDACLISHEHGDHTKSIYHIAKLGINCIGSPGTLSNFEKLNGTRVAVPPLSCHEENGWKIKPFQTEHDSVEPTGFMILSPSGKKIVYATDTYFLRYRFTGVNYYLIECNYKEEWLHENEDLTEELKARIRWSHFEIENVKDFFKAQDLSRTEKIFLIHLSDQNAEPEHFKKEIEELTGIKTYVMDS